MPYLGRELTSGNYLKLDDISSQFDGSTVTFQLKSGGSDFFPGSSFSLLVSVAGVIQEADSAYQINNNEITFATAPSNGDDAFIIVLGLALGIGVPGDGTVGLQHLQDSAKLGISTSNGNTSTVSVGGGVTSLNFAGPGVTTAFVTQMVLQLYLFKVVVVVVLVLLVLGHLIQSVLQPVKLLVLVQHKQLELQTPKVHYSHLVILQLPMVHF